MYKDIFTTPIRKIIFLIGQVAFLLVFTVGMIGWPLVGLAAYDTVTFDAATDIDVWGAGQTLTVSSGSKVAGFTVYSTYISIDMESGSIITFTSPDQKMMTASPAIATTTCNAPYVSSSGITLTSSTTQTVTLTPTDTACQQSSSGGGGGGVGAVVTTATATEEREISFTTEENTVATIDLPAGSVSSSTDVKITTEAKTKITTSHPIPSGKSIVGNYVYDFSATSGGVAVTGFSKDVTLSFTYSDEQITGFYEDTLKVYYWDGVEWLGLASTVDKENKKVIANTDHFTYFVIMGETEAPVEIAKPEDYGLKEGNLIRAEGDFDIFIINQHGYKRLFLNPAIFEMYGHLGSWDDVIAVTPQTRDAFIMSSHYRADEDDKVYHLEVTGEDTGTLHWINITGEEFLAQGGTANAIFTINKDELDWYPKGEDKMSL